MLDKQLQIAEQQYITQLGENSCVLKFLENYNAQQAFGAHHHHPPVPWRGKWKYSFSSLRFVRALQCLWPGPDRTGPFPTPSWYWGPKSDIPARSPGQTAAEPGTATSSPDIFYLRVTVVIWALVSSSFWAGWENTMVSSTGHKVKPTCVRSVLVFPDLTPSRPNTHTISGQKSIFLSFFILLEVTN